MSLTFALLSFFSAGFFPLFFFARLASAGVDTSSQTVVQKCQYSLKVNLVQLLNVSLLVNALRSQRRKKDFQNILKIQRHCSAKSIFLQRDVEGGESEVEV